VRNLLRGIRADPFAKIGFEYAHLLDPFDGIRRGQLRGLPSVPGLPRSIAPRPESRCILAPCTTGLYMPASVPPFTSLLRCRGCVVLVVPFARRPCGLRWPVTSNCRAPCVTSDCSRRRDHLCRQSGTLLSEVDVSSAIRGSAFANQHERLGYVGSACCFQPAARFVPVAPAFRPERRHITTIVHAFSFALPCLHVAMPAEPRSLDHVLEFKGFSPE